MRTYVFAVAVAAAAVFAIPTTSAFSQVDVEIGRHGVRVGHDWAPGRCREMRRPACTSESSASRVWATAALIAHIAGSCPASRGSSEPRFVATRRGFHC